MVAAEPYESHRMGLLTTIFKRKNQAAPAAVQAPPAETAAEVARARTRARRRLIGAVVLVAIGIVGFPLVFETQPRPIPVDIPIEIPRKDGAAPLAMPPARVALNGASGATAVPEPDSPPAADVITEKSGDGGRDVTPADTGDAKTAPQKPVAKVDEKPADKPAEPAPDKSADKSTDKATAAEKAVDKTAQKPAESPAAKPADAKPHPGDDGARAAALLAGKEAPKADANARYIVQVGAFTESSAAQETRSKIEKLGLKTYTQVAATPGGNRIRVRMGPFATRDDADKALAKAKAAGVTGVVLTL
jgi:DedD protein